MDLQRRRRLIDAVRAHVDGVSGDYRTSPPESPPPFGLAGMTSSDDYVSGRVLDQWPGRMEAFRRRWEAHSPQVRRDAMAGAFPDADRAVLLSGTAAPVVDAGEDS